MLGSSAAAGTGVSSAPTICVGAACVAARATSCRSIGGAVTPGTTLTALGLSTATTAARDCDQGCSSSNT